MAKRLSPYQRIMRASVAKKGVRLSAHEVAELARDHAIEEAAAEDDERDGREPGEEVEGERDDVIRF